MSVRMKIPFTRRIAVLAIVLASFACDSPTAPVADHIEVVSGAAQVGAQGIDLPEPVVIRVLDAAGQPMAGVNVEWRAIAGGGSVVDAQAITDAEGRAQATWVLGIGIGQNLLLVSAAAATITITAHSDLRFSTVAAGRQHTCALSTMGTAYCWGDNGAGQLGDATGIVAPRATPLRVAGNVRFAALTAGSTHTCGITDHGEAYCWGANSDGQLGIGNYTTIGEPTAVSGGRRFVSISAGYVHTCAVTTDGVAYCWGSNGFGQLGVSGIEKSGVPVAVNTTVKFKQITTGEFHTCALAVDDSAYCWGWNSSGELGSGADFGATIAQPVQVAGNVSFADISAGFRHTCAIGKADGAAYCWGRSAAGEIGTAQFDHRRTPNRLTLQVYFNDISASGNVQSCGLAGANATDQQTVYCWGSDSINQNWQPAAMFGPPASALSVGFNHACAVQQGEVWCWGVNDYQQLGVAGIAGSAKPVKVVFSAP